MKSVLLVTINTVFTENGSKNDGKFSQRIENAMGKGEIACCFQFFLFHQSFQKICTADA